MTVSEYHLYRVKLIKPAQFQLFSNDVKTSQIFEEAINEKPSLVLKEHNVWHIANIEYIDITGGRFAVGRTTKTTVEKFDNASGDFIKQIDDSGPYTLVYFYSDIGLIGITKKTKVAPDVKSIASRIKGLFEKTAIVQSFGIEVRVDPIPDPESFLEKIKNAYSVTKFKASFTGPNPVDADELFQKPISVYCSALGGENGSIQVFGESLDKDVIEAVTKSTAATANTASARIKTERNKKPVPVYLKGEAVKISIDDDASSDVAFYEIRQIYDGVRYDR